MKRIVFFFLLLLVPSFAFAQQDSSINYDKCEYDMIHQNIYAPFYVHVNHEPSISQTFKSRHDDNPNVTPFQRAPEGVAPGEATWFEFGSSANATATYEFELGLEYQEKVEYARPITIQVFSQNTLMMEKKIFQESKIGCVAFRFHVEPPPHVFTSEEILAIAKLEFVGITKQYADQVNTNTQETQMLKTFLITSNIITFAVVGLLILNDRFRTRALNDIKSEYDIRNSLLATSIAKMDTSIKTEELKSLAKEKSLDSLASSMSNTFGVMIQNIDSARKQMKDEVSMFISDLRSELEFATKEPEEQITTFADIENLQSQKDNSAVKSEPNLCDNKTCKKFGLWHPNEPCVVDEPPNKAFGFDLESLKSIAKPLSKIIKKEKVVLSDIEKLREEWSDMPNEELLKVFDRYQKQAVIDINNNILNSESYQYSNEINIILSSRSMDVN